jgi:Ser/Thr protein kinase RdoA (MazF antagonist)
VLAVGWGFVIGLEPLPVVARVTTVGDQPPGLLPPAIQVELAAFAAARGAPVVPPLTSVDPGPHHWGRFVVTLWERIAAGHPVTPESAGRSLRQLHEIIADFGGALPSFDPRPGARRIAAELPAGAQRTAEILCAACDACLLPDLPEQPLHGDAHLGNALGGPTGPLWNDFEYACVGPIEWDLACVAHRATVLQEKLAETTAMLAGYGRHAAERASLLADAVALHAAAQTAAAVISRPDLAPLARRRLDWVRDRLG